MKHTVRKFVSVFGIFVIIVSLFSGCATAANGKPVVNIGDLNYFQIDCSLKEQQIAFLQSLRISPGDGAFTLAGISGYNNQVNWMINYHLIQLRQYC